MSEIKPEANNVQFLIQRVYTKDVSFEAPGTPQSFREEWNPELELDLHTNHEVLEPGVYEVTLHLTATAKNKGHVAFLVEIKQSGIFTIQGTPPKEQLDHLLGSFCPTILFPYARERVTSMVVNASFPPLVLAPINFDAIYLQRKQKNNEVEISH